MSSRLFTMATAVVLAAVLSPQAPASWELVDDFEGFNSRLPFNGQNGWTETSESLPNSSVGDMMVVEDPDDAGNHALQIIREINGADPSALKALPTPIADGTAGTLFLRIRQFYDPEALRSATADPEDTFGGGDINFGLSDKTEAPAVAGFSAFESQAAFKGLPDSNQIRVRGPSGGGVVDVGDYPSEMWTNVWMVANNATGTTGQTTDLYMSTGFDPPVYLGTGGFRSGNDDDGDSDLISVMLRSGFGQSQPGYIDDIYVNAMGQDFSNPTVPEPSAIGLLVIGVAMTFTRRRSRT